MSIASVSSVMSTLRNLGLMMRTYNPEIDSEAIMQMNGSTVSAGCHIQGNIQVEEYDTHYGDMKPEPDTDRKSIQSQLKDQEPKNTL